MTPPFFDHEKLNVYQASIRLVAWIDPLLQSLPAKLAVRDQLDRATTSIPLNLAEGNGRFTPPDRCRFFDTARGSALECAACLDVLVAKALVPIEKANEGKELLHGIVCMLIGLVRAQGGERMREDEGEYRLLTT
jgi:four helix bundle protein